MSRSNTKKIVGLVATLLSLLIFKYCNAEESNPLESGDIRIVSYNVENLYDTIDNPKTKDDDLTPEGALHWTDVRYKKKLNDISNVIYSVGGGEAPALVGLCEIENDKVLTDLLENTELKEDNYKYIITKSKDFRGANVALLYQPNLIRIIGNKSYRPNIGTDYPRYSRDLLHVTGVIASGDTLDLFVCHYPSRSGGIKKSNPYRIKVSEMLKQKTDDVFAKRGKANIIIMGDFNDYPEDESMRKTLGAISINAEKETTSLHNMFLHVSNNTKVGSYKYKGKWKFIDQFIVSSHLLNPEHSIHIKDNEAHAYSADFMLEKDRRYGGDQPYRTYIGFKYIEGISDHLPIYMDLKVKAK